MYKNNEVEDYIQTAEGFLGYSILQEEFADLLQNDLQGDMTNKKVATK